MKDLEKRTYDFEACARCNHRFLLPVGMHISEILKINEKVRKCQTAEFKKCNGLSSSRRPPRPKPVGHTSQKLACMCSRLNCMSRLDGLGCMKCMRICKEYRDKDSYARPMFDSNLNCTCDVCDCNCTALYYRDQSAKLALQSKAERQEKMTKMKDTKISAFFNFKADVFDMSRKNMAEVNDDDQQDDVIARTAIDMTKNTEIQGNVKRRLELQREVGVITPFVNGKSMSQLRKEKRKQRKTSIYEESCHLKHAAIEHDSSIVTPSYNDESPKNNRWYNNRLMDGDGVSSPPISVNSPQVSTLSFTEDINLKRTTELKKKVLRRLIDNTSPTSELKKNTFKAVVNNKAGVDEILAIACEMVGDNMSDTVNLCKQMLMDNVL